MVFRFTVPHLKISSIFWDYVGFGVFPVFFFFNVYNVVLVEINIKRKVCHRCCIAVTEVVRMLRMTGGLVMSLVLCCELQSLVSNVPVLLTLKIILQHPQRVVSN